RRALLENRFKQLRRDGAANWYAAGDKAGNGVVSEHDDERARSRASEMEGGLGHSAPGLPRCPRLLRQQRGQAIQAEQYITQLRLKRENQDRDSDKRGGLEDPARDDQ